MEAFAFYLIKSIVWLTGFALVYFLFLRNERFFILNRIYLVSGMLISMLFPLFTWHYTIVIPVTPTASVSEPQIQGISVPEESFSTQSLLLFFYLAGIIFILFRIFRQTFPVFRIIRKSEIRQFNSIKIIQTTEYPASFSFISFVFVNPSIGEIETNEIVNHEAEHIRQKHWIDLLLFEILRAIQWFNPVIWLYGRLIRQNHEYLADEKALQRSSNPAVYRAALLNQMFGVPVISLANSFNYSLNKKRFTMMKHTIQSPFRKLKLLLILPFVAGVFYAFSAPEYQFVQAGRASAIQEGKTISGQILSEDGKPLKGANIVISGKTIGTISDDSGNFKLEITDDSPIVVSYVGYETMQVAPDNSKEMHLVMKKKTIELDLDKLPKEKKATTSSTIPNTSLIFINGIESTKAEMDKLKPDDIQSVSIMKDEDAFKKYGKKGKDGVIEITLKSNNQPLYIVDGKPTNFLSMDKFAPDSIESISVLKNESATKLYGVKGKNGVVLITTKKGTSNIEKGSITNLSGNFVKQDSIETHTTSGLDFRAKILNGDFKDGTSNIKADTISINFTKTNSLLFIDGKESSKAEIDQLNPNSIASISVWKGDSATAKYGEKGKDGVIEINTKAKTPMKMMENMPQFPGGPNALRFYLQSSIKYPEDALKNGIQGKVYVSFTVEKDGSISDIKVNRSVSPSLDKEAIRVVKSMPKWNPAMQNGEPVSVSYTVPVKFTLPVIK